MCRRFFLRSMAEEFGVGWIGEVNCYYIIDKVFFLIPNHLNIDWDVPKTDGR